MQVELLHVHQQTISCYSSDTLPTDGFLWLLADKSEIANLNATITKITGKALNERHLEDLKQPNHPCFYEGMTDYDLVILRSVSDMRDGSKRIFPVTTFIIFENLLVTVYDNRDKAIAKIRQTLSEQKRANPQNPSVLAEFCLGALVDQYLDIRPGLDNKLNTWQKKLLQVKATAVDWNSLLAFKTDVRRVRMLCEEQLDALNAWLTQMRLNAHHFARGMQEQMMINLNDVADHANRAFKLATQLQQELESLMQLHFTILSHRTNEIMRILAIVTCIFLPPNLITGIFGMNFTSVPDLSRPHAFYYAIFFMLMFSGILWLVFKWRKWL